MRRSPFGWFLLVLTLAAAACSSSASYPVAPPTAWNPPAWADENTIELGVIRPDGSPHWFNVWIAVLDGQAYVRLGSASVSHIEENREKPYVGVRVAGHEFRHVRLEPAPDAAARVATMMASKHWSDVLIRLIPHPVTARLIPEP